MSLQYLDAASRLGTAGAIPDIRWNMDKGSFT
jgi:hypothetical protein